MEDVCKAEFLNKSYIILFISFESSSMASDTRDNSVHNNVNITTTVRVWCDVWLFSVAHFTGQPFLLWQNVFLNLEVFLTPNLAWVGNVVCEDDDNEDGDKDSDDILWSRLVSTSYVFTTRLMMTKWDRLFNLRSTNCPFRNEYRWEMHKGVLHKSTSVLLYASLRFWYIFAIWGPVNLS